MTITRYTVTPTGDKLRLDHGPGFLTVPHNPRMNLKRNIMAAVHAIDLDICQLEKRKELLIEMVRDLPKE